MYQTPCLLARQHYHQITLAAASAIKAKALPFYSQFTEAQLAEQLEVSLDRQLRYLETGDLNQWREYCTERVISRGTLDNLHYEHLIEACGLLLQALASFFREQLLPMQVVDEIAAPKLLQSLENRLGGLLAVAIATGTAVGMRPKK
jgi:hypothetical protein